MITRMARAVLLSVGVFHTASLLADALIPPHIQRQLDLPERKIDVGIAALTFAKEVDPDVDIAGYSRRIDQLVDGAQSVIQRQGRYDPDSVVRALNTFFYQVEGFHYDFSPDAYNKPENRYLTGVLDTKQGTCFNLPMLYMAVAQRLGYPVYPVTAPDHVFLRFVSPDLQESNIEATAGGGYSPDEDYIERLHISARGVRSGAYLKTLSYRQFLALLLETNAIAFGQRGQLDKAIHYLEKVVQIYPKSAPTYNSLRIAYIMKSKQARAMSNDIVADAYREKAEQAFKRAEELGYTKAQPLLSRGG